MSAASITWGNATAISGNSDVSTSGTLVGAFNMGLTGVSSTTVNGVTFNAFPFSVGGTTATSGNFTFSGDFFSANNTLTTVANPFASLTSEYRTLLSSIAGNNNTSNLTLSMSGLSTGSTYQYQSWYNLSPFNGVSFNATLTSGNVVTLSQKTPTTTDGQLGQFVLGRFTADASSQSIIYNGIAIGPSSSNGLNAFQLRNITPASAFWKGDVNSTWNTLNGTNTNWATAQNGTTDTTVLPGPTTDVTFSSDNSGNKTTTLGSNFTIKSLTVNDAAAVTIGGANTLTITDNQAITVNNGAGLLTINATGLVLSGATPTIAVNGASTTALISSGLGSGTASLTKTGNGTLTLNGTNTYAGNTTVRNGTLAVNSGGSINHSSANLTVGLSSGDNATLSIGTGGSVSAFRGLLGFDGGATGTASVSGGNLTLADELYVGTTGNGVLNLSNGTVSNTKAFIGVNSPSVSSANVTGGVWNNSGELTVGYGGRGSLAISGTGTVNSAGAFLGYLDASDGNTVTISGPGASWNSTNTFYLGHDGSNNTVTVSSGALLANGNADFLIGSNEASDNNLLTVTGNGSRFTSNGTFYVGRSGTGNQFEVFAGGNATSRNVRIGGGTGSVATTENNRATVDGAGSLWNVSGTMRVGSNGDNSSLTVSNGGRVNVTGNTFVGYDAVSQNNLVRVTGNGSTLSVNALTIGRAGSNNTVSVEAGGNLTATNIILGELSGGSGALQISGDGRVVNTNTFAGNATNTTATLSVTDNSVWQMTQNLYLGYNGNATLAITGNGSVSNEFGTIGTLAGSVGNVTVSGGFWVNTQNLTVGLSGSGSLAISGNGSVSNITGSIGSETGSFGNVTVSGGNWTNSGSLFVGGNGTGLLTLSGNGIVQSLSTRLGFGTNGNGTMNLNGGLLLTGQVLEGSGNGTITFNGGTLRLTGNQSALFSGFDSGDITIEDGGGTIDTQSFDVATSAGFSGTGAAFLNKIGTGTFTMTGTHSFTGVTNVDQGTLLFNGTTGSLFNVSSGATLGGNGTINAPVNVLSGGTLAPGGSAGNSTGVLSVGELRLNPGSNTRIEINGLNPGTEHDQIQVTGNADLDGTLDLLFGFAPTVGDRFTLITAGNFTLSGNATQGFDTITTTGLGATLKTTVEIDPTNFDIVIDLLQGDFRPFAGTPNQQAIAAALDELSRGGTIQDLIDYLNSLPEEDLPGAFDLISAEELAALANTGFANTRGVFNLLQNRIREIQNGQQFSGNGLTLWDNSRQFQQSLLAGTQMVDGLQVYQPKIDDKRLGFFVSGQGVFGDVDGDGNGDQYDFTTGGMIVGSDYRLTPSTAIGLYAGYQGSTSQTSTDSETKSDSAKFGAYGSWWHEKGSWLSANIGGGVHGYDSERVSVGGIASGTTGGREINAQLAFGHDFKAGKNKEWTFGPEADVAYTRIWIDGFTESGSLAPLAIEDQEADSLRTTLAWKVSYDWQIEKLTLRPYGRLGWQHEFMDDQQGIGARFAGGGGSVFTVQSPDVARDSIVAGAGLQILFSETISAWMGYNAEANQDYEVHSVNGSFSVRF
ncbi:MAG: autotransporter domain-containing protein [Candidatus Methylacidiphilales bacterium]|nr:autotransporter domain-containing protein [Candidatus Methylacidiphilales bacterium]